MREEEKEVYTVRMISRKHDVKTGSLGLHRNAARYDDPATATGKIPIKFRIKL